MAHLKLKKGIFELLFLPLIFLFACNNDSAEFKKSVQFYNNKLIFDNETYIVIPMDGCKGCIQSVIRFLKKNIKKENEFHFIITRIRDFKLFKLTIGKDLIKHKKIIVDLNDIFTRKYYSIYPQIFELKEGEIISHHFITPKTKLKILLDLESLTVRGNL